MKDVALKYILTAVLGLIFSAMCFVAKEIVKRLKKREERSGAPEKGTQSLLRADIIRSYDKYMECGCCPIYAKDALILEYDAYHNLGANGTITDLMNKLRELPTEPPEEDKK